MLKLGNDNRKSIMGNAMLFACAVIWGFALVAQRNASESLGAFAFDGLRFFLATAVLLVSVIVKDLIMIKQGKRSKGFNKSTLLGGLLCGISIFFGNNLQQLGVELTSIGKAGFITSIYIVIVPIFALFAHRKPTIKSINAILIALLGFYLMCLTGDVANFNKGDLLVLGSAVMISLQIVFIDLFVKDCDPFKLTLVQFFVASVMSVPAMAIEGFPTVEAINVNIGSVLYVGLLSAGVAFTLQTIGQRFTKPETATLIMSLESAVGLIAGVIFFKEEHSAVEIAGCMLVFISIFVVQFPSFRIMLKPIGRSKFFIE